MIELKNYINGKYREGKNTKINPDVSGFPNTRIHLATQLDVLAAIENVNRIQWYLTFVDETLISQLLLEAMDSFLSTDDYSYIAMMTGSSIKFVESSLEKGKKWAQRSEEFLNSIFPNKPPYSRKCKSPTLAILPSNSEEVSLFVIVQALLARSALLIRASSRGAASFTSIKFIEAWNRAIDRYEDKYTNLKQAIALINVQNLESLWKTVSVDNWNYVVFGSHATAKEISESILHYSNPRKIILYDAGLSCTVIDKSIEVIEVGIPGVALDVLESVRVNRGNECLSSDIIYVHSDVFESLLQTLNSELALEKSLPPTYERSAGVVSVPNCDYITETAETLADSSSIRFDILEIEGQDGNTIHRRNIKTSLLILMDDEKAMVYPGPIASVRSFSSKEHLLELMAQDLLSNQEEKFLACSLFGSDKFFADLVREVDAFTIKHNKPSHEMNLFNTHQGIWLVKELLEEVNVEM